MLRFKWGLFGKLCVFLGQGPFQAYHWDSCIQDRIFCVTGWCKKMLSYKEGCKITLSCTTLGCRFDFIFCQKFQCHRRWEEPNWTVLDCKLKYFRGKFVKLRYSSLNTIVKGRICKKNNNGCSVWIVNSVTQDNCWHNSASPVKPNSYPCDGIFNPHLTTI